MKKFILSGAFLLLLGSSLNAFAAPDQLYVVANAEDGSKIGQAEVVEDGYLQFSGTAVEVYNASKSKVASFDYNGLKSVSFTKDPESGITSLKAASSIRLKENPVFESLEIVGYDGNPSSLTVFDMKGGVMLKMEGWNNEAINVSSLQPGLYFVTINKTTLKFIKK